MNIMVDMRKRWRITFHKIDFVQCSSPHYILIFKIGYISEYDYFRYLVIYNIIYMYI